jgi:AcrR family transcriptional regulator
VSAGTAKPADGRGRRSSRKRDAIMDAATETFLREGYLGTTIDAVAAQAAVSKPTVYNHFADKRELFTAIVLRIIDQVGAPFYAWLEDGLDSATDLETSLDELARKLVSVVQEPRLLELRRLVISEAARFPDLGRTYVERGPGRTVVTLSGLFEQLTRDGVLRVDDPQAAAQYFNWLVLSIPINRAMFDANATFTDAELDRYAAEAVRIFLAAYRAG